MFMAMGMTINPAKYTPQFSNKTFDAVLELAVLFEMTVRWCGDAGCCFPCLHTAVWASPQLGSKYESGYFANHLGTEIQYVLNALVTSPKWVSTLRSKFVAWAVTDGASHLQADFASFWLSGSGVRNGTDFDIAVRPQPAATSPLACT